ncbi:MAG TPA: isoleucine--tRNA ligase [Acidimicrobiia bacterium]|jgi:isoleucyl-tRNA synthetase|nr:isoleucine--tRNA ligase [Acidimicrobiia bacterium]
MPFESLPREVDLVALEERVLRRWADDDVFGESLRRRDGAPEWVFYEGPPTANGQPGLHHVWARSFKDLYPRFHTMRGRYVARKGGWDCHGLPVELEVERELGFSGKPEIEEFGVAAFNQRCRESVHRYVEDWSALTTRIGMWLDTANAYWTLTNEYIESVWWHLRQLWDAGLVYEGFKVVPYCARCGTALSSHEVALGYEDVVEPSVYVRFPLVDDDVDLLVWTTTPWTLVSNVAAAVGPDVRYARVRAQDGRRDLVLAAERVAPVLGDDAEVVADVPVATLVGRHYERPFDVLPLPADAARVVAADFVTVEDGSGVVHLAPAFGEVDREVGEAEGLPMLNPVDAAARFDHSVPPYRGRFVKDADPLIIDDLAARGRLERVVDYEHSYPHCWRCATPLIYWAKPTWFARTSEHRAELLRENETVGWHPEHIKHGRFGDWLEHNVDWALSRDRFWGTPLPFWRCEEGHDTCVGSVAELAELAGRDLAGLDLHRPDVDEVAITCPTCGARARRVEAVLDAWFDSGAMPASQWHYPFEHADRFERRFPADFVCEAIDQTRGWFYSLLAVNTLVFGRAPYRHVVCLAHIVDRDGQKMSKSRGNVLDPWTILRSRGADALRWYFFSAGSPWTSRRVDEQVIDESTRRFLLTLWNTASFFVTYANLDGWEPGPPVRSPHVLDRWIRSRLHATVGEVTDALEGFDALRAAQALDRLVDDCSNWYVRRSRPRFWKSADPGAPATLHECLTTISLLLAPFCPFLADELHRTVTQSGVSVHLADWPAADPGAVDPALEAEMAFARRLVTLGLAARNEAGIKVRQPLRRALVLFPAGLTLGDELRAQVADELNVKALEPVRDLEGLLDYSVAPRFRTLGPRLGPLVRPLQAVLAAADGAALRRALETDGRVVVTVDGQAVELGPDDVDVRARTHESLALAEDGGVAVALDTALDDELRSEGLARELVRALNEHRKALGLDLADRVRVELGADGRVAAAARRHADWIQEEVLATDWRVTDVGDDGLDGAATLAVDGDPVRVRVDRV